MKYNSPQALTPGQEQCHEQGQLGESTEQAAQSISFNRFQSAFPITDLLAHTGWGLNLQWLLMGWAGDKIKEAAKMSLEISGSPTLSNLISF